MARLLNDNKVYIVEWHVDYDGNETSGVFSDADQAIKFAEDNLTGDGVTVYEYPVGWNNVSEEYDYSPIRVASWTHLVGGDWRRDGC